MTNHLLQCMLRCSESVQYYIKISQRGKNWGSEEILGAVCYRDAIGEWHQYSFVSIYICGSGENGIYIFL